MRLLVCAVLIVVAAACSARRPPVAAAPPPATPAQRLESADALVRAGCLECLLAAYGEYDLLRAFAPARQAATAGAIRSAALVSLRQRELGMVDEGYGQRARALLADAPDVPNWMATLLDIIEVLPLSAGGIVRPATSDIDLERGRILLTNRAAWTARLQELAPVDELATYIWLSFACGAAETREQTLEELFGPAATFADTPLVGFKRALCRGIDPKALIEL